MAELRSGVICPRMRGTAYMLETRFQRTLVEMQRSTLNAQCLQDETNGAERLESIQEPEVVLPNPLDQWKASEAPAEEPSEREAAERSGYGGANCLTLYLREVGKVKLLTVREEVELAVRIKQGDNEARELMIKANLRLVVKIARDYEGLGLPLMDMISEGNVGLMKAVERFDPTRGAKLSTYASWWIKQGIKSALANQSRTVRLPV